MTNPLLTPIEDFIDYKTVKAHHIEPALKQLLEKAKAQVETIANQPNPTWDTLVEPLHDATEQLWRAWSVSRHLNAVVNTPEFRRVLFRSLPKISAFSTWLGQHQALYALYKTMAEPAYFEQLSAPRQRAINLALQSFVLNGADLDQEKRAEFAQNQQEQATTSQQFAENVLDSTDHWALYITDEQQLAGIPADVLAAAQQEARQEDREGWKLSLKMSCYLSVMQYAENAQLRETMYRAYSTIASEQSDEPKWDNSQAIETLLALRIQEAELLGFEHFAECQLQTRMADSAEQTIEFLRDLAQRSKPYAKQDYQDLEEFAHTRLGLTELNPWDVAYVSE